MTETLAYFETKGHNTTKMLSMSWHIAIIDLTPSIAPMLNNKIEFC